MVGQNNMFINFQTLKKTKKWRALVVADEGDEVLVDLETHIGASFQSASLFS